MGRRPIGIAAMTSAERTRRHRAKFPAAPKPTPEAIIRDLQADLDAMDRRLANRDAHIRELEAKLAAAPAPAKAPPRPTPTRKELKEESLKEWYLAEIEKAGGMKIETFRALVRCLHPDTAPTAKQRAEASGLLTQYWQGRHGHRTKGRAPS